MKIKEALIQEIIKIAVVNFENLEQQFKQIEKILKNKKVEQLSIKELQNLLAYETWKDGAEKEMVQEIIDAKEATYKTKTDLLKNLEIYGY